MISLIVIIVPRNEIYGAFIELFQDQQQTFSNIAVNRYINAWLVYGTLKERYLHERPVDCLMAQFNRIDFTIW